MNWMRNEGAGERRKAPCIRVKITQISARGKFWGGKESISLFREERFNFGVVLFGARKGNNYSACCRTSPSKLDNVLRQFKLRKFGTDWRVATFSLCSLLFDFDATFSFDRCVELFWSGPKWFYVQCVPSSVSITTSSLYITIRFLSFHVILFFQISKVNI